MGRARRGSPDASSDTIAASSSEESSTASNRPCPSTTLTALSGRPPSNSLAYSLAELRWSHALPASTACSTPDGPASHLKLPSKQKLNW